MRGALSGFENRTKTDLRLPQELVRLADNWIDRLGIAKNALFTLGMVQYFAGLVPLTEGKRKQRKALDELEDIFQKTMAGIRANL